MLILRSLALLLIICTIAHAAPPPLAARIRAAIASSPVAANAYWGIEIADATSGTVIFSSNAQHFFVPASNIKLLTTALTLTRIGAQSRIRTTVTAAQLPDSQGVITGDLFLNGAGDPSLKTVDLESLANQLYERGIRRIEGAIVGDDSLFLWEPYNPGWSIDDAVEGYGAPVSALSLNDNALTLHVLPTGITFEPPVPLFTVENQIQPDIGLPKRIHYERLPGSPALRLWGTMPPMEADTAIMLGVDDPARYAALVLFNALQSRGVQVVGKAQARHLLSGSEPLPPKPLAILAEHESAPLVEDLRLTDKTSQNQHAETYLRLVSSLQAGQGSRADGLLQLHTFLEEAGVNQEEYNIYDGSGLSRLNVLTPHAVVTLLRFMYKSPANEDWLSLLSIGGVDGTLENRMKAHRLQGRVIGKTGSLSHVSALSGYVKRRSGKEFAFSILVNNYNGPSSDIRTVIDKICSLLVD